MGRASGNEFGTAICEALGLIPEMVSGLTIRIRSHGPATVIVERFIFDGTGTAKKLVRAFQKYALEPKVDTPAEER